MAGQFHTQVSLRGFSFDPYMLTFNLAAGITRADANKAVTLDPSAPNTMKLAGDDDEVWGRIFSVEDRQNESQLVGTIELHFAGRLPVKTGTTPVVGNKVVGAGGGEVKTTAAVAKPYEPWVAEVDGDFVIVVKTA